MLKKIIGVCGIFLVLGLFISLGAQAKVRIYTCPSSATADLINIKLNCPGGPWDNCFSNKETGKTFTFSKLVRDDSRAVVCVYKNGDINIGMSTTQIPYQAKCSFNNRTASCVW